MCLGIHGKVVELYEQEGLMMGKVDFGSGVLREAFEACDDLLEGVTLGFRGGDATEREDTLLACSQCMRDNNVPDFPDPQTGAGTPYPLTAFADFNDPTFQEALEICRQTVSFSGLGE